MRNERNLGFARAMNIGFRARSRDSKYVALLNNDAVPVSESLRTLVEVLEANPKLGAVQGVIMHYHDRSVVDSAGGYVNRHLLAFRFLAGTRYRLKHPVYISYADGAYSVYRIAAVMDAMRGDRLFLDEFFAYCDDNVLGFLLWTKGWRIASFPFIAGYHRRGATFGRVSPERTYNMFACASFLLGVSRGVPLDVRAYRLYLLTRRILSTALARRDFDTSRLLLDAWRYGRSIASKYKGRLLIDYRSIPKVRLRPKDIPYLLFTLKHFNPNKSHDFVRETMEHHRADIVF